MAAVKTDKKELAYELWREWFDTAGDAHEDSGRCFFCRAWVYFIDSEPHESDCIYIRARELVAEADDDS